MANRFWSSVTPLGLALLIGAGVGCGSKSAAPTGGSVDMAGSAPTGDMGAGGCAMTSTDNASFLNSCAPATVDFVEIQPTYPSLAPNGVLPALP